MVDNDWIPAWFRRRWPPFRNIWDVNEVFDQMNEILDRDFQEFAKRAPKDLVRERTLPDGRTVKEWGPFVYGYSVKLDPDGTPHVREFGNIKPSTTLGRPRIDVKAKREPLVDILETDGEVKVVVELPGVEKDDITLHGTLTSLTIAVDTPHRKYYKDVQLPVQVDPKQATSSYKNGVLDITLPKREDEKPKGEYINIE